MVPGIVLLQGRKRNSRSLGFCRALQSAYLRGLLRGVSDRVSRRGFYEEGVVGRRDKPRRIIASTHTTPTLTL